MSVLISTDEKRGTTTIRHTWRFEVYCEFEDEDPLVKAHRQEVVYDTDTMEVLKKNPDRVVLRHLSELPEQIRAHVLGLGPAFDAFEAEDIRAEQARQSS